MIVNRVLNPAIEVKDRTTFGRIWTNLEKLGEGVDTLAGAMWADVVARVAFGGITDTIEDNLNRLSEYEEEACVAHGVPRKRAARKGVAATDFVVPPTFKSYKSTIKGALEHGVELLDANGMPRSRSDVADDLAEAKKVIKSDEEKLANATDTWLAIFAKCNAGDMGVVQCVRRIIEQAEAAGLTAKLPLTARRYW